MSAPGNLDDGAAGDQCQSVAASITTVSLSKRFIAPAVVI
jgi:hypothetical protein